MLETVQARLKCVKGYLVSEGYRAIFFSMTDPHGSENPGDCDRWIEYLTGFTGSAGTLIIFDDDRVCFWADGRYHIQAEQQLGGYGIEIFKEGLDDVPSPAAFLSQELADHDVLAVPEEYISASKYDELLKAVEGGAEQKQYGLSFTEVDLNGVLSDRFWPDRPERTATDGWVLPNGMTGVSPVSKVKDLRRLMENQQIDHYIVSKLDTIGWLLNLRGNDIIYTPVLYAYLIMGIEDGALYLQPDSAKSLPAGYIDSLKDLGINIRNYTEFYEDLERLTGVCAYDKSEVSHRIERSSSLLSHPRLVHNAEMIPQSIKHPSEVRNMHKAHLMDGIALTKLIYDLKVTYADSLDSLTELDISRLLEEKKTVFSSYIEPSFETISAYAQNAAIVHYAPRRDSSKRLAKEGFLLLDSGGQYFEGTTDVTRTIALGPLTHDEKLYYTAVLKGHLQLMKSLIDPQTPTRMLDEKARRPLWDLGVDYLHGTGHGVGFVLSVHEGPVRIINANNHHLEDKPLLRGNIVSDEPGYYREGAFGVRIENLLVVERTAGRRLYFDPLTVVPYEPDAILADEMTEQEITWLNRYHAHVYEKLAPHLSSKEREWLQLQTAPVKPRGTEES